MIIPSLSEHIATAEKEQDFALPFDKVPAVEHVTFGLVSAALKKALQERSDKRVRESKDFAKLAKDIELFKARKASKTMPLNEKELRERFSKENAEKLDQKVNELDPEKMDVGAFKFKRTYVNEEVLRIVEDFPQGKTLVTQP